MKKVDQYLFALRNLILRPVQVLLWESDMQLVEAVMQSTPAAASCPTGQERRDLVQVLAALPPFLPLSHMAEGEPVYMPSLLLHNSYSSA